MIINMHSKHSSYGYLVFVFLVSMPVILWMTENGVVNMIFEGSDTFTKALGKVSALSGLAAYSLMPILSMRHRVFEKAFGGLDVLYNLHRNVGKISFMLILSHPLFLIAGGILGGAGIVSVWNWASIVIISGIVGLAAVTALTALTIYAHIKHQKWIAIHRLFGWLLPVLFFMP